jgi:hypothetical protein
MKSAKLREENITNLKLHTRNTLQTIIKCYLRTMRGRSPTKKEKEWMDSIANFGCVVCHLFYGCYSPAEIHHIDGKTKPQAHLLTLPLCFKHHREGANNDMYVSRHPFKNEFERRYGKQTDLLDRLVELIEND